MTNFFLESWIDPLSYYLRPHSYQAKANFSLMLVFYSLIFFACPVIFFALFPLSLGVNMPLM